MNIRWKLLEAEKLQHLAETQRKKEEAQARREEERKAASAAREAKAVEQVRKKEVRAKAQREEAELQAQKLAERLRESEFRRKLYLEQIRERAAMDFRDQASPSSRRPPSRDGQPRSVVNQIVDGYLGNAITGLTGFAPSSSSNLSQQQSLKKRVKKIRQRLMALKYEFVEPPMGAESTGRGSMATAAASRSKIGRWLQDLQRLQQTRKAGATSIGLIIGEMIKAEYVLPLNFEEVATGVLKIMNNLARLDLMLIQNMLARPDLQMEFFHLMSFLLSHCTCKWKSTTDEVALVLFETLLLLGYFALLHSGNQAVLRWGKSPTILHKICDLPFAFFSDPQLTPVLVGTLLAVCYGCEQNRNVVQQELSMDMLLVLLKSSKQDISVVSDSRQTIVPRVGIQLDAQSNSISYQSGNMDVIEEESEEEMQKILGKDHGFSSQDVSAKPSEDSPVADIPGSLHQQLSGRSSKTHLVSSDHANNVKRSNRTVNKTVFQGDLSLKESIGTKTNSLGRSVKSKPIGPNKETFTHQAKYSKVSNPDTAQKISSPVSAKRGISVVLPDLKTNSPAGIQLREFKYARDYQDNPLLSPAFMLQNRFPINLIDCAQEFFAAGLE